MMFRAGDLVEVRSKEEILGMLGPDGRMPNDRLPFMPEMLQFCGRRFRVAAVAHKTCDTATLLMGRRMRDTVFLEDLRCDGSAHGGCQARCLLFWKTQWLKPVDAEAPARNGTRGCSERQLQDATHVTRANGETRYFCQATEHWAASEPLRGGALGVSHFLEDVRSRNARLRDIVRVVGLQLVWRLRRLPRGWRLSVWLYDRLHRWVTGRPDPYREGAIPDGAPTPDERLDLQPGEWVEVKSHEEILQTVTAGLANRGLKYNAEMTPACGQRFRVAQRVSRLIEEKSGRMLTIKNPCITLEGVYCRALYTPYSLLCSRRVTPYFREIWLRRASAEQPLVSIGLPVFNGERYLEQAMASLLNQTYRNIELIVSDNASTDATPDICRRAAAADARVRYSRMDQNVGGVPNANRVCSLATGRYFMWASHDDLWEPTYVERCVERLERDPGAVLVCSEMAIVDGAGTVRRRPQASGSADSPRAADRLAAFTDINAVADAAYGVTRIEALRATRLYALHPGHDKILLAELALRGRIVRIPEHLYFRREHDERSVKVYPSLRQRYAWVSPACAGKRQFPHWAFLRGYTGAVLRAPLRLRDRAACGVVLLQWVRNYWRQLAKDLRPERIAGGTSSAATHPAAPPAGVSGSA